MLGTDQGGLPEKNKCKEVEVEIFLKLTPSLNFINDA